MRVTLEKVAKFPGGRVLAHVRTPFGHTAVRWCGDPAAEPGEYHVEWAVDEALTWGHNAKPASCSGPGVRPGGHGVVLCGHMYVFEDGAAALDLGGTPILLDLAAPLPEGVAGSWVEICVERENVALWPYGL
ncbi:hypothetical protein OHT93_23775 [Streptomyces sp. NBC_00191]|uniref:hypothetical protein n=1 Tax=Streptomyces sp. NBC_00191 TaxID=2975674 RepID=UPI003255A732